MKKYTFKQRLLAWLGWQADPSYECNLRLGQVISVPASPSPSAIAIEELIRWLQTLQPDSLVRISDGGLSIVEVDAKGKLTGAYLELGARFEGVDQGASQ